MDALDDLAMVLAVGLPVVLVSAGAAFLALTDEAPREPEGDEAVPETPRKR